MSAKSSGRHILSKSTFIRGCQCPKSLYLYKNAYKTRDPLSAAQRAIFARGTNVGLLARELFAGGRDASPPTPFQYAKSAALTAELVASGEPVIYEAAFIHEGVLAAMDLLVREDPGPNGNPAYAAYEVKSSTGISETYLLDAALQYWVLSGAGLTLSGISIVHIDSAYQRQGELELDRLFHIQPVTAEAQARQEFIERKVAELKKVPAAPETPKIAIGPQCTDPYPCDFMGTCWKGVPGYSVFDIARLADERKFELYHRGIVEVGEVPDDYPLSDRQRVQVEAERSGQARIDHQAIRDFLDTLVFPLHFIDFESFQPAVPRYDRSHPYQQLAFQFSLDVLAAPDAPLDHVDFLAEAGPDPRPAFTTALLEALGTSGSVLVYNQGFEAVRLAELARDFPEHDEAIEAVLQRIVDLMLPFQRQDYYTPAMQGSYSIKQVLPALVPELSYEALGIRDGTAASIAFERLIGEERPRRRAWVRKQLLDYCRMDTTAMVRIYEALRAAAAGGAG